MNYYKLCFYVPKADAEVVKAAVFAEGAGQVGDYSQCCFEVEGKGQFLPSGNANPSIGRRLELATVTELKVEMVCHKSYIKPALQALLNAHPYEEPAYHVWPIYCLRDLAD